MGLQNTSLWTYCVYEQSFNNNNTCELRQHDWIKLDKWYLLSLTSLALHDLTLLSKPIAVPLSNVLWICGRCHSTCASNLAVCIGIHQRLLSMASRLRPLATSVCPAISATHFVMWSFIYMGPQNPDVYTRMPSTNQPKFYLISHR